MGRMIKTVPPPHKHDPPILFPGEMGDGSQYECSCGAIFTLHFSCWQLGDLSVSPPPVNRFTTKAPEVPVEEPKKKKNLWDVIKERATKGTEWGGPK